MPQIDRDKLFEAIAAFFQVLKPGYQDFENLVGTPRRITDAYLQLLTKEDFKLTTFPNEGYNEMVIVKDIPFVSLCEHHLLPFMGTATIGYIPNEKILGLSKFGRLVDYYAHDLQVQERLTVQIAEALDSNLAPLGVGVILRAEHMCMAIRGVEKSGVITTTSALKGSFANIPMVRSEFMRLAK